TGRMNAGNLVRLWSRPGLLDLVHGQYFYLRLPLVHLHGASNAYHLSLKFERPSATRKSPTGRYISSESLIWINCPEKDVRISALPDIGRNNLAADFNIFSNILRSVAVLHDLYIFATQNRSEGKQGDGNDPNPTAHDKLIGIENRYSTVSR